MPISTAAKVDFNESMLNLPGLETSIEMNTQARTLVITGLNIL